MTPPRSRPGAAPSTAVPGVDGARPHNGPVPAPLSTRAWLATRDDSQLEQLLELRPDLRLGAPLRDLDDLALRLEHPASVISVLRGLPQPAVEVLELVAALDAGATEDRVVSLLHPSGAPAPQHVEDVRHWVALLETVGLAWWGEEAATVNPGVHRVVVRPLGLGPPARVLAEELTVEPLKRLYQGLGLEPPARKAELLAGVGDLYSDPTRIRQVAGQAPGEVAELLLEHAAKAAASSVAGGGEPEVEPTWTREGMQRFQQRHQLLQWAVDHGLAVPPGYGAAYGHAGGRFPSEVLLALAPPTYRAPFHPAPPPLPTQPVSVEQSERSSAAAITGTVAAIMAVLESLARTPATRLKAGGVGARELARMAKAVGVDPAEVRLGLELGARLRLLEDGRDGIRTSANFEEWRRTGPPARGADLLGTWWTFTAGTTRERDEEGRALPALAGRHGTDNAPTVALLGLVLKGTTDAGVVGLDPVLSRVRWIQPMARFDDDDLQRAWDEAQRFGVVVDGRLTRLGQAVQRVARDEVEALLTELLPEQSDEVLFGSDLTVIAPGTPGPSVIDLLDTVGTRETHGVGAAWRVSETSVRDALDAGFTVEDLLADLRRVAGKPLPQTLAYLLKDVGRRHGRLTVRPAGCVVVSEDEALLAEVAVTKLLSRLGLVRVAPTVLVSSASPATALEALRKAGYLPVEVDREGQRVVELRRGGPLGEPVDEPVGEDVDEELAALLRAHTSAQRISRPEPEEVSALVERLRSGRAPEAPDAPDELVQSIEMWARRLRPDEIRHLATAVAQGDDVVLRYVGQSGGHSERRVSQLQVGSGYLFGYCHLRQDLRHFRLDRVVGVFPTR